MPILKVSRGGSHAAGSRAWEPGQLFLGWALLGPRAKGDYTTLAGNVNMGGAGDQGPVKVFLRVIASP